MRVLEYLIRERAYYSERCVGVSKISFALGYSPNRVLRALRALRAVGIVVRNVDPRRKKFSCWSLSRYFSSSNLIVNLNYLIDYALGRVVLQGKVEFIEWLDSFVDKYYISGTTALLLSGLSWNEVASNSVLIIADEREKKRFANIRSVMDVGGLSGTYSFEVKFVDNLSKFEYGLVRLENCAVPVASQEQAIVDSLVHYNSLGVDLFETMCVLIGIIIPRALEDNEDIDKIVNLSLSSYPGSWWLVTETLRRILMLIYIYFGDSKAIELYRKIPTPRKRVDLPSAIKRGIKNAFRATILGNRVAAELGLEPDFSSPVRKRDIEWLFSVAELV